MPDEYHRGGNPDKEVDSDQDNDEAPIPSPAAAARQEPPQQGGAGRDRNRARQQRHGVQQGPTQPRKAAQQAHNQPRRDPPKAHLRSREGTLPAWSQPPLIPIAQRPRQVKAAAPAPGHRRSSSTVSQSALVPQLDLGSQAAPGLGLSHDLNLYDPRFPLSGFRQPVPGPPAPAAADQPYSSNLLLSLPHSSRPHLDRASRPGRPINMQVVFDNHHSMPIGLRASTGSYKTFQSVIVPELPMTIVHESTINELGLRAIDMPPITNNITIYVQEIGSITPRKWLHVGVKLQGFEGVIDIYVVSSDYPPFHSVLLQDDNRFQPLGSRQDEAEDTTGFDPRAQAASSLQFGQLEGVASTFDAATAGGLTAAHTMLYPPSEPSLSYDLASSGELGFVPSAGQQGTMLWSFLPAQPDIKVSQRDGATATPLLDYYPQNSQGLDDDAAPSFQ